MNNLKLSFMLVAAFVIGAGSRTASAQHDHGGQANKSEEDRHRNHQRGGGAVGNSHERIQGRGGSTTPEEFFIEPVFMPDQIRLYLYDAQQNPMHVNHGPKGIVEATGFVQFREPSRGAVSLEFAHATPGGYACPMHPDQNGKTPGTCTKCGMEYTLQDYLVAPVDLGNNEAMIAFNLKNLPGTDEQSFQFIQDYVPEKTHDAYEMESRHGEHESRPFVPRVRQRRGCGGSRGHRGCG